MSVVQVTALLLVLGTLGKKMAMVSRKIDAVTIIDAVSYTHLDVYKRQDLRF